MHKSDKNEDVFQLTPGQCRDLHRASAMGLESSVKDALAAFRDAAAAFAFISSATNYNKLTQAAVALQAARAAAVDRIWK